jgi:hypothetical protein
MKDSKVTIKVKAVKGTGFMPEAGEMSAVKSTDVEGVTTYKIAESASAFAGHVLCSSVVVEV